MRSTSKNMQLELNQMQQRIQCIKNQMQIKNSIRREEVIGSNQYTSKHEEAAVRKCYKKCMRLIKDKLIERKERLKTKNNKKSKNILGNKNSDRIKGNIMCNSGMIDNINNIRDDIEIVTLDEDSSDSCNLIYKSSVTAPSVYKKTISKSNIYQKVQVHKTPEVIEVAYLNTINSFKTAKSKNLNHKRNIDHIISESDVNNMNSLVTAAFNVPSVSSCKISHSKSNKIMQKENARNSFDKKVKVSSNNSREISYQDIKSQTVNNFSEFHSQNNKQNGCGIKYNLSKSILKGKDCESQISSNLSLDIDSSKSVNEKIRETINILTSHSNEVDYLEQVNNSKVIPVWDFTEEPVDFPIPLLHNYESTNISCEKLKDLKSKAIEMKTGLWTKEEIAILKRNFKNFTHQFGVTNVSLLLGIGRKISSDKRELKNVKKFWKVKHFLVRLGKDLNNRFLNSIYAKARKLFYPLNNSYVCSSEDISNLLNLQKKYGNQWQLIAKKFGRHYDVCQKLYLKYAKCTNKGKWSDEETNKLIDAVRKVTKSKKIMFENLKRISWNKVSENVPTRSAIQCYDKWQIIQKHKRNFAIC